MSSKSRGPLDYFLGSRANQDLAVVQDSVSLAQALRASRPAILLLGPGDFDSGLLAEADAADIARIGPDSFGVIAPHRQIHHTISPSAVLPGNLAFVTQSGALGGAILDWAQRQKVGFSAFVSLGRAPRIGFGDCIDYLAEDPHTKSILLYMESLGDAAGFISAARECALAKPIIVLRAGRKDRQRDAVFDAMFRRCGVLRVERLADLFYLAEVLHRQPRPAGGRLSILSNANGPALLASDALDLAGGELDELVDLGGGAGAADYERELKRLLSRENSAGALVILAPQPMTEALETAKMLAHNASRYKPIFASFMGADLVREANTALVEANIPAFPYPDTAARAFQTLWQYSSSLRALYETPIFAANLVDASKIEDELRLLRSAGRESVDGSLLARVLDAYGIECESREAKITQPLRLRSEVDATFGPVLYIGAAGFGEEIYRDLGAALPPLTSTLARRALEQIRIHRAFSDATLRSLEVLLVRFSRLVSEMPVLRQLEIYPLCAESGRAWAGGYRATLQPLNLDEALWPRSVIRPYPSQYVTELTLRDGTAALLRPIRPEDEKMIAAFHSGLSERSVYLRYLQFLKLEERVLHERLARVCFNDYARELALVLEQQGAILGVGRLQRNPLQKHEAEVAFLVRDDAQGKGIGGALVKHLLSAARAEGLRRLTAELLADNTAMRHMLAKEGFSMRLSGDGQTLLAALPL